MVHKTLTLLIYLTAINVACFASVQNQRAPKSIKTTTADLQKQTARDTVKKSTKIRHGNIQDPILCRFADSGRSYSSRHY